MHLFRFPSKNYSAGVYRMFSLYENDRWINVLKNQETIIQHRGMSPSTTEVLYLMFFSRITTASEIQFSFGQKGKKKSVLARCTMPRNMADFRYLYFKYLLFFLHLRNYRDIIFFYLSPAIECVLFKLIYSWLKTYFQTYTQI